MGIIRKRANNGFSGKTGSIVGSDWRTVDYIKGLSKISNNLPEYRNNDIGRQYNYHDQIKFSSLQ